MGFNERLIDVLSYGTIVLDLLILILLVYFLYSKLSKKKINLPIFLRKNSLLLAFVFALIATSGSLFFSEIMKYVPCKLCWFQRIFMYPLVLLLGFGLIRKSKSIGDYSILMSVFGGAISIYHIIIQSTNNTEFCGIGAIDCIQNFIFNHSYVTIPIMALTAFISIIIFCSVWRGYVREK